MNEYLSQEDDERDLPLALIRFLLRPHAAATLAALQMAGEIVELIHGGNEPPGNDVTGGIARGLFKIEFSNDLRAALRTIAKGEELLNQLPPEYRPQALQVEWARKEWAKYLSERLPRIEAYLCNIIASAENE